MFYHKYLLTTYFASQLWYIFFLFMVYFIIMSFSSPILISALFKKICRHSHFISGSNLMVLFKPTNHFMKSQLPLFLSNFEILMIKNYKIKNNKCCEECTVLQCTKLGLLLSSYLPHKNTSKPTSLLKFKLLK